MIFITISMYIINLSYLEDKLFYFTKLPNGDIEKLDRILIRLDISAIIPKTDNQDLSNQIKLEAE